MRTQIGLFVLTVLVLIVQPSRAATITVASSVDSGPGTLRQAIATAASGDTIVFSVTGTISLTNGELLITKDLTIAGPGAGILTIQRATSAGIAEFRIFNFQAGIGQLSGLTVSNGRDIFGGGINVEHTTLAISDCVISGNAASDSGGGVENQSTLNMTNCVVRGNQVIGGAGDGLGGGVDNNGGTLIAAACRFESNSVVNMTGTGFGGGLNNRSRSTLTLVTSTVSGNSVIGNSGEDAEGGGIFNEDTVVLVTSTVSSNTAFGGPGGIGQGGGIDNHLGTVILNRSTLSDNRAVGGAPVTGGSPGPGVGGGLANDLGTLYMTNSTVSQNMATGNSGTGGGGIASSGAVFIYHCTIATNQVAGGDGGGLANSGGVAHFQNTILAANTPADVANAQSGTILSDGFNLIGSVTGTVVPGPNDRLNITAAELKIGPLQNNGGPTLTHALLCGSPAIDTGTNTNAPATDQRGFARLVNGTIDIGAFEYSNSVPGISCFGPATITCARAAGALATVSVDVTDAEGDSLVVIWMVDGLGVQTNVVPAGGPPTAARVDLTSTFAIGAHPVSVFVFDTSDCVTNCSTSITVIADTNAPSIQCAQNKTNECSGGLLSFDTPTATDDCGTVSISILNTVTNLGCGNTFVATRTWLAMDNAGNTNICNQTIASIDTTAPSITCAANKTNECGVGTLTFDEPTASDTCGTATVSVVGTVTNLTGGLTFVATRTWLATDACGNSKSCSQTIATIDTTRPTITCNGNKTNECGVGSLEFDQPSANDTCGAVTISIVSTVTNLGCGNTFVATRTWLATDSSGNTNTCSQTIANIDTTAPSINCAANKTNECGVGSLTFEEPTASDTCGTATVSVVGTVTNLTGGSTFVATRTWMATDGCGNSKSCSQTIATVDTTRPTITCNGNKTNECGVGSLEFDQPTANDTCGAVSISIVSTVTNLGCGNTFVATRTWLATDSSGNTNTCSQTIANTDTTAPSITCAANKTNECGVGSLTFEDPTASDTCGTATISVVGTVTNLTGGSTFVATRTWMATDACGNSKSCSQTIATVDTTRPTITCNGNKTNECGVGSLGFDQPSANDTCGAVSISIVSTVTNLGCGNTFVATRTWVATDSSGNTNTCSQTIANIDTTAPNITCAANKTNECGVGSLTFDDPTASDTCGTATVSVVGTVTNLTGGSTFVATRTWMATDGCGNSKSCSQTIATVDTTRPTITCNGNKTNECGVGSLEFDQPSANDTCGAVNISIVSTVTNLGCGNTFVATRTWLASDSSGNTNTCSQIIANIDTTAPSITCAANKTNECGVGSLAFDDPTASDTCGTATVSVVGTVTNLTGGSTFVATRTWMATDGCGNSKSCSQTIATVDTTRPTITCSGNKTNECGVGLLEFDQPTANDKCGTVSISILSTVTNLGCGNTFVATRTWLATDSSGNTNTCSQTIANIDTTAPSITCAANKTNECGVGSLTFVEPTASDTCGTATISVVGTVTNLTGGSTFVATRTWMATDGCGNSKSCSQTIATVDTTRPTITCNGNKTNECGVGSLEFDQPTANDTCGAVSISIVSTITNLGCGNTFVATRTWVATDGSGNTNTCSQAIANIDTTAPNIRCAANKTNECGVGSLMFEDPTASDTCGTVTVSVVGTVTNLTSGSTFVATRTWVATDACGNSKSCSQTIAIVDTTRPTISCSVNKTNECGVGSLEFDQPSANDTCGAVSISILSTITNRGCGSTFVATRTWLATDSSGNTNTCSQTIANIDTTAPSITCSGNKTNQCGLGNLNFDTPIASDSCGSTVISIVSTVTNSLHGNEAVVTRTWSATDSCGNSRTCSQTIATKDTTSLSISCPAPVTLNCSSSGGAAVTVTIQVKDANPGPLAIIWAVDGTLRQTNLVSVSGSGSATVDFTAVFPAGIHTVLVSAGDTNGCVASCSTTVTVLGRGDLYPIALNIKSLQGVPVGGVVRNIFNGIRTGNFGWLTWAGSPSEPTLVKSLTPPGNSNTYINPRDPGDHVVSIGDWVQGKTGLSNSDAVRRSLNVLETMDIIVPVWDQAQGRGNNSLYHVVRFARVRLLDYQLPRQNRITARFLGFVDCE